MKVHSYMDFHKHEVPNGLYRGVPNNIYHAFPALSSSQFKHLLKSSKHWSAEQQKEKERKDHFDFGSALHTYALERELWNEEVIVAPQVNKRTKEGRETWKNFLEQNKEKTIIEEKDVGKIKTMYQSLKENSDFMQVMTEGMPELSVFTEMNGVMCRCRPDWIDIDRGFMVDLKTTQDASKEKFVDHIYNFGYHRQAAFYLDVFYEATGIRLQGYGIIALEKEPPYAVCSHQLHTDFLGIGREEYKKAFARYKMAVKEEKLEGYETGFHTAVPKPWMYYRTEDNNE